MVTSSKNPTFSPSSNCQDSDTQHGSFPGAKQRSSAPGGKIPYGKRPLVVRKGLAEKFRTGKGLWSYGKGWRKDSVRGKASGRTERAGGEVPYGKRPLVVRKGLAERFRTRKGLWSYGKGRRCGDI